MLSRRMHKCIGLVMLIPIVLWALTGFVFLLKPGYSGAYEVLQLKTYPLENNVSIHTKSGWDEVRIVKSILGLHLLVKSKGENYHLSPETYEQIPVPEADQLRRLFADCIAHNVTRYGEVLRIEGTRAYTTTGVTLSLDWNTLQFTQIGIDRKIIGTLYKIHYLQWTPWPVVNNTLGIIGLLMLFALSYFGIRLYAKNRV